MANIKETSIVICLSKLVKTGSKNVTIDLPEDLLESLEAYVSEVIGDPSLVVEIQVSDSEDE